MTRVTGFHGTSVAAADAILGGDPWIQSSEDYDWLGDGVYFWQDAPERAWTWARGRHGHDAAVLRAEIELEDCFDLLNPNWFRALDGLHDRVLDQLAAAKLAPPVQRGLRHGMDRLVINYAVGVLAESGVAIRSVRAAFAEGVPAFPGSALMSLSHVQIAVLDVGVLHDVAMEAS
jgi:hypothetical protein